MNFLRTYWRLLLIGVVLACITLGVAMYLDTSANQRKTDKWIQQTLNEHDDRQKLDPSFNNKNQVYQNDSFGIRIRYPEKFQIVELKPDSSGRALVAFNDHEKPFPFIDANFLLEMRHPEDIEPKFREGFTPLIRTGTGGELVINTVDTSVKPFGYFTEMTQYGYSYQFWAYGTDYTFDVYALEDINYNTFVEFLRGIEFFEPVQKMPAFDPRITDIACGISFVLPSGWTYQKDACVMSNMAQDIVETPTGGKLVIGVNKGSASPDFPLLEEAIIDGYKAKILLNPGGMQDPFPVIEVTVQTGTVFSFSLYDVTDNEKSSMIKLVKTMKFGKQ